MNQLIKTACISTLCLGLSVFANAAQDKHANHNNGDVVDVSSDIGSLKEDLAYAQVFSEICPKLIGNNKNFDQAYKRYVDVKLKDVSNPQLALQFLNEEDEDYKNLLQQFRQNVSSASSESNRAVCLDMIEWGKKK
ncbi:hypothetical protein GCM10023206_18450 [Acinetobacter puyangensis]|uniref:DUF7944 domain-containing protein n=1 Tax=Acinetobacter puyangensis TaxID=1096779 RepID=A0A240E5V5_9GAMM|nr:hypothetical protein [Acinetobacter puyangensis]SNX43891.1 hypothetical protein SAMN05421731_10247 [Acinetobacter puyangensis]